MRASFYAIVATRACAQEVGLRQRTGRAHPSDRRGCGDRGRLGLKGPGRLGGTVHQPHGEFPRLSGEGRKEIAAGTSLLEIHHIAETRISIGCISSHKLKTLKPTIPASIGSWAINPRLRSGINRLVVAAETQSPYT